MTREGRTWAPAGTQPTDIGPKCPASSKKEEKGRKVQAKLVADAFFGRYFL